MKRWITLFVLFLVLIGCSGDPKQKALDFLKSTYPECSKNNPVVVKTSKFGSDVVAVVAKCGELVYVVRCWDSGCNDRCKAIGIFRPLK